MEISYDIGTCKDSLLIASEKNKNQKQIENEISRTGNRERNLAKVIRAFPVLSFYKFSQPPVLLKGNIYSYKISQQSWQSELFDVNSSSFRQT